MQRDNPSHRAKLFVDWQQSARHEVQSVEFVNTNLTAEDHFNYLTRTYYKLDVQGRYRFRRPTPTQMRESRVYKFDLDGGLMWFPSYHELLTLTYGFGRDQSEVKMALARMRKQTRAVAQHKATLFSHCSVCLTTKSNRQFFILTCGHRLCKRCTPKCQSCPQCRQTITNLIPCLPA